MIKKIVVLILLLCAGVIIWKWAPSFSQKLSSGPSGTSSSPVAVEAEKVRTGPIALKRVFSGELEANEKFVVAPKVSGRVEFLAVDIGDKIRQGHLVARLDHEEFTLAVTQAQADLAVARADEARAQSSLEIAGRDMKRIETLKIREVSSEAQLDEARSRQMVAKAGLEIARANVTRASAALETARVRLGYTEVKADWSGTDDARVVARTFVAQGDMVSANSPMVSVVDLDPIIGVIWVTEKDYGRLETGLQAELTTDAFPGRIFWGKVARIAPVFREDTRQARVELTVDNGGHDLKPGMFIRAGLVLDEVPDAVIVPESALTRRDGETGVFLIEEKDAAVVWQPVTPGIRDGDQVQVSGISSGGRVVTLGQQMLDNGSNIVVPGKDQPQ